MQLTSAKKIEVRKTGVSSREAVHDRPPSSSTRRRDERTVELCEAMIDIAAALFNVSSKEIRRPGRTNLGISRVRQVAMYVAHVVLKLNMTDIGKAFGRDRTTVVYACHLIEDLRDDADFDRIIIMTERVALAAFGNRIGP